MARVQRQLARFIIGAEVADKLVAEEVKRDPVGIAAGEPAAEQIDVEPLGQRQVCHGYGEVKGISGVPHGSLPVRPPARRPAACPTGARAAASPGPRCRPRVRSRDWPPDRPGG